MRTISQDGRVWRVNFTGVSHESEGQHSAGVRFENEAGDEVFGSLTGIPPEDFGIATDDQLIAALEAALAGGGD